MSVHYCSPPLQFSGCRRGTGCSFCIKIRWYFTSHFPSASLLLPPPPLPLSSLSFHTSPPSSPTLFVFSLSPFPSLPFPPPFSGEEPISQEWCASQEKGISVKLSALTFLSLNVATPGRFCIELNSLGIATDQTPPSLSSVRPPLWIHPLQSMRPLIPRGSPNPRNPRPLLNQRHQVGRLCSMSVC